MLPSCSFKDKSVDVGSVFRVGVDLFGVLHEGNVGLEGHVIKGQNLFSGSGLHDGSEETHGVEEVTDAEGVRSDQLCAPFVELSTAVDEFVEPQTKVLPAGVGFFFPGSRHFVDR